MKRRFVTFALVLTVLFLTQAIATTYACHKELIEINDADGDGRVEVGEYVEFVIAIFIRAYRGADWYDIVVYDRIAAELDVISIDNVTQGSVEYYRNPGKDTGKGNNGKTKSATELVWTVGDLERSDIPGVGGASLYFTVATNYNPAGKQRYTSPGWHELNSGATLKCIENGHQYSEYMESIWIYVEWPD